LNIIFAGTPEFSCVALQNLLQSTHKVIAVFTQPDRPSGRGRKLTASPVKEIAHIHDIPVDQPVNFRAPEEQEIVQDLKADIMIVVAYGILLPKTILEAPRLGCLNIHASLLPYYRGAAPIQRAILAGDKKTGVTIMQMDTGLDTGPMLYKMECDISETDTSQTLHDRLAILGGEALLYTLENLHTLKPEMQNNGKATYAHKITKEEAKIDWKKTANEIALSIRAFYPWPVAYTEMGEHTLRVYEASVIENNKLNTQPGEIVDVSAKGIDVATHQYILRLLKCQLPGGRVLSVSDMLNAKRDLFIKGQSFT
jgi:methionyl-tRNA formyltransferase